MVPSSGPKLACSVISVHIAFQKPLLKIMGCFTSTQMKTSKIKQTKQSYILESSLSPEQKMEHLVSGYLREYCKRRSNQIHPLSLENIMVNYLSNKFWKFDSIATKFGNMITAQGTIIDCNHTTWKGYFTTACSESITSGSGINKINVKCLHDGFHGTAIGITSDITPITSIGKANKGYTYRWHESDAIFVEMDNNTVDFFTNSLIQTEWKGGTIITVEIDGIQ